MSNMMRTQIYLTENQAQLLRSISDETGRTQSDLIREGVDAVIAKHHSPPDWKAAVRGIAGIWKDHENIEADVREGRQQAEERLKRLFAD